MVMIFEEQNVSLNEFSINLGCKLCHVELIKLEPVCPIFLALLRISVGWSILALIKFELH